MMTHGIYPLPTQEDTRVKFVADHGRTTGVGIFTLCWMGIEEVWDVLLDDGTTKHLYPCFGDTMVPVAK